MICPYGRTRSRERRVKAYQVGDVSWYEEEFVGLNLGDKRLEKRLGILPILRIQVTKRQKDSDIFELFNENAKITNENKPDLIVRARSDRNISDGAERHL